MTWALPLIGLLLASSTGCNILTAVAVMTEPDSEKIPPEYKGLEDKTVVVHVWALPEIRWAYQKVELDLAGYLSEYLEQNVEDVVVVDYYRVASLLEKKQHLQSDPIAVGDEFGADVVVHLSVYKMTMQDRGMAHFYRGRLAASVVVYEFGTESDTPERVPLRDVVVAVPEDAPLGVADISPLEVRQQTYFAFTEQVGRKFHEYERPLP
jgi:hypothetical protein